MVNVTCKLGTKGCFEDGRCHALVNCKNKITTNADRIRSMNDAELAVFLRRTIWNEGSDLFDCDDSPCDNACWKCDRYLAWLKAEAEEGE